MSAAEHFDALRVYAASAIRLIPRDGEPEDMVEEGGDLAERFEEQGQRPLVGVLRDPEIDEVLLADGDLVIEVRREGPYGRLRVAWGSDVVTDELVPIPAPEAVGAGPWFRPDPESEVEELADAIYEIGAPLFAVMEGEQIRWYRRGIHGRGVGARLLRGTVQAMYPEDLGSPAFREAHGVRWAYVVGAMAGGIASADLVLEMASEGVLAFFGAGGLPLPQVEIALRKVAKEAPEGGVWGFNLLHNPNEPKIEEETVDLYLKYGVRRVSASAYMTLTPALVRYRVHGIHRGDDGEIVTPNQVFAKVSRPEIAERFLRPPPADILRELVETGAIDAQQAELAKAIPVAEDITAEADSGGHTDRRPLLVLLPILQRLRDQIAREEDYGSRGRWPRVGAAGGLGTPQALWAAFAMGADYVLTGSVNQASVEAATSRTAKGMLCKASYTDVSTGPAPDMFELGAHVQVLSRGTMYAQRAQQLYDAYKRYPSIDMIPEKERAKLEKRIFKQSLDEVWEQTQQYWSQRDPRQVEKAEGDPRHKMALIFRWYLGLTSRWARTGQTDRKRDFQMWCGPSMGAFNAWVGGSRLEALDGRRAVVIAEALMNGATVASRITQARGQLLPLPPGIDDIPVLLIDHTLG